ncbi:MAG TPA: DNA replication/repair protein RecF [Chloroflexota bacterium]|nr:DNA replication/repair protein RecF [Chloroflexota bacterium]
MWLKRLSLTNFRSYVRLGLELPPGIVVFHGANGQGKTNLLEAVHVLATTKSARAGSDRELLNWLARGEPMAFARIAASVGRQDGEVHVDLVLRAESDGEATNGNGATISKQIRVGGLPRRAVEYVGTVNAVLFSPEDVTLVGGPPAGRRRYLDITLSQVNSRYLRALQRYNKVLMQRNHLLRQVRDRRQPAALLEPWDSELVTSGAYLVAERGRLLAALNARLPDLYRALSGGTARLEAVYRSSLDAPRPASAAVVPGPEAARVAEAPPPVWSPTALGATPVGLAERFQACLLAGRERELTQGVSLVGPHRDDLEFLVDGVPQGVYGSRGQQRLSVVALKLAEVEFMRAETGESPLLLLDDVLSELDPARQRFVLDTLGHDGQTLLTTTDLGGLDPAFLARARVYRVEDGTLHAAA